MESPLPTPVLSYARTRRSAFAGLYLWQLPFSFALGVILGLELAIMAFRFREIFSDFRTDLPMLTEMILGLSAVSRTWYGWLVFVPVVLCLPLPVALIWRRADTKAEYVTALLVSAMLHLLMLCLLQIVGTYMIFYPLFHLTSTVTSSSP